MAQLAPLAPLAQAVPAASAAVATQSLPLPRKLGRRVLLKLAARGGMGDVYLAATTGIEGAERPCIVKTVRRDHCSDSSFLARFLDEARVQAQLQHPGVAQVLEAASEEDGPYTVVEYVEGRSLCDVRQRALQTGTAIGWANAVAIAIEIAQALAHVHERSGPDGSPLGIVHRDLSPQNVMVSYAGEVKLIDFGTARGHNRRSQTVAGVVFAKPGYVAPEVARQQMGDGRIDLYALGIMLWELCAGRRFLTTDPQAHLDNVAAGRVVIPAIAEACAAPSELDRVIGALTKNDPDERYSRAALAVTDLAKLLACAPPDPASGRGIRARTCALMHALWPHEPARARAEFVRLLREACRVLEGPENNGEGSSGPPSGTEAPKSKGALAAVRASTEPDDPSRLPGTPYRLLRSIGEGSSGVVWEAEHTELQRRVAVKVLSAHFAGSRSALERFRNEARAMAALSHPNLVQILDFGKSLDGRVFLAMELLAGETLHERLRHAPLSTVDAVRVAINVCAALDVAHRAGLVHRDVKPQNLMLTTSGRVKLLDFGVATRPRGASDARTASVKERSLQGVALFGTPQYMAPEQVTGGAIDRRTDIYALGCVLYEMLVGAPPFDGSSWVVMGKQLRETPEPLRKRVNGGEVPRTLKEVVTRAMSKDRERRFASAAAMRVALEEALRSCERQRTRGRRLVTAALVGIAACAAAAVSARWTGRLWTPEVEPAAVATPPSASTLAAPVAAPTASPGKSEAKDRRALSLPARQL